MCVSGSKPETHPDITLMRPKSVLQRLRTRMGVPRGLMPSATFEDTFTSAASCRRPTRGLQDPQNVQNKAWLPDLTHLHTQAIPTLPLGPVDGRGPNPKAICMVPFPTSARGGGSGKLHRSLGIIDEVRSSGGGNRVRAQKKQGRSTLGKVGQGNGRAVMGAPGSTLTQSRAG